MEFQISLWNYIRADKYPFPVKKLVQEWQDLRVTLGCSLVCDGSKKQVKITQKLIAEARRAKIGMLAYDTRVFYTNYKQKGKSGYEADVRAALSDFEKYENVKGFLICDEPNQAELKYVGEALDIFKKLTKKIGFVNFSWCDSRAAEYGSRENYADVIAEFAKNRLAVIANDRYSCLHARDYEKGFKETGIDKYFADLNCFKSAAEKAKLPYFVSLLSVGHWMYRTPTEADIRWQLSTSFAHGANGIQWFFINQHRFADEYYEYPVNIYGERTPVFEGLVRQTREFLDKAVKPLEGYEFTGARHIGKCYGGTPALEESAEVYAYADHGQNGILSAFEKNGKRAYLLVNNDQNYPEVFFIKFKNHPEKNYHIWLNCGGTHIVKE